MPENRGYVPRRDEEAREEALRYHEMAAPFPGIIHAILYVGDQISGLTEVLAAIHDIELHDQDGHAR